VTVLTRDGVAMPETGQADPAGTDKGRDLYGAYGWKSVLKPLSYSLS
jgi:hypothetical protein